MKSPKTFFDTNVLLYLLSGDTFKADRAEEIVSSGGVISIQVLNEFASVAYRKLRMTYPEIKEYLQVFRGSCSITPLNIEMHELALNIAENYGFSLYDSMIVSAALMSHCNLLYSEDMQHGQRIENKLLINNPFIC